MLPVLDNFNRALDSASGIEGEKLKDFQQFFDGIVLVNQHLNEVLMEMGVEPIMRSAKSLTRISTKPSLLKKQKIFLLTQSLKSFYAVIRSARK